MLNLWYGYEPFEPADNGSTPLTIHTPVVRAFAERNVQNAPEFYRGGPFGDSSSMIDEESAIVRETRRLSKMWNGQWCHHLNQDDVDALVEAGRLINFTHTWDSNRTLRWQPKEPPYRPTAAEVNEWAITNLGHDAINADVVIRPRCEREDKPVTCSTCHGSASVESYPGQHVAYEAW